MKCTNNYIGVQFDDHEKTHTKLGNTGVELLNIHKWQAENNEDGNLWDGTKDKRLTNPEIAVVTAENPKLPYRIGQKLFMHFLAYESGKYKQDNVTFVDAKMVFFAFDDDDNIYLEDDNYLGEQVMLQAPTTASGIILTPYDQIKKDTYVKITHIPKNSKGIAVGDVVVTTDGAQFTLKFKGKEYVKIHEQYIVGTYTGELSV